MPVLSHVQEIRQNATQKEQIQLLFQGCEAGDLEAVRRIVSENKKSSEDYNTLYTNKPDAQISWLLNAQCDTYWTPVMFAARYGHLKIVQYLVNEGAAIDHANTFYNPLHAACFG